MNALLQEIRRSVLLTLVLALLLCGAYPVIVWGIGQGLFPEKANGSLLKDSRGDVVGSRLIGQSFVSPRYFHPRPSAAGAGYDGANSSGSNLGPTSRKLAEQQASLVKSYRDENQLAPGQPIPADAVTASASGLDPHISLDNARLQAPRVASVRGLPLNVVLSLVDAHTDGRDLGILGEPGVNVLALNVALDQTKP